MPHLKKGIVLGRPVRRLSAQIDLLGGMRASISTAPARGRWPAAETLDRLTLPLALGALSLLCPDRSLSPRVRHRLMSMAVALVEDPPELDSGESWTERVAGCRLVGSGREGQPRIRVRLVDTRSGARALIDAPRPAPLTLASATAVSAAAALAMTTRDVHLVAALAIEGMLLWCREPRSARDAPQQAVARGLAYAHRRLEEARRPTPEVLVRALSDVRD